MNHLPGTIACDHCKRTAQLFRSGEKVLVYFCVHCKGTTTRPRD